MTPRIAMAGGALLGALLLAAASPAAAPRAPATARDADELMKSPPSRERDRALARWAREASLADLMWLLRHDPERLGGAEAPLVEAAIVRTSKQRVGLRQRLALRLALVDRRRARARLSELAPTTAGLPTWPRASVFRLAALLPDSGSYADQAAGLRAGLEIGLAASGSRVEVRFEPTGDDDPPRALESLARVVPMSGLLMGEVVERPTLALSGAARMAGLPLVVPAALPEGGVPVTGAFRIGPSDHERGRALARSALAARPRRIGILVSSAAETGGLLAGFEAGARERGSSPAWRHVYPSGSTEFRAAARSLAAERVELLFWDGDPRELEALARQLAQDRLRVELCGGGGLDPARHHAATRSLLEGARFAGEEWSLPPRAARSLDSALVARGDSTASPAHVRGWLAARLVALGLSNGALSPEELLAALESLTSGVGAERGVMRWSPAEATLPVYVVRRGAAVVVSNP
jgi:ABC-type branched-subunit amino acid transport system substrate-binding protein